MRVVVLGGSGEPSLVIQMFLPGGRAASGREAHPNSF